MGIKNSSDSLINRLDTGEERNSRHGSKEMQREIIQNETKEKRVKKKTEYARIIGHVQIV